MSDSSPSPNASRPPVTRAPHEGELIDVAGDRYRFLATSDHTGGAYTLWEAIVPPGGGPPPHRHHREEEGFFVIEGRATIHVNGRTIEAGPGSFVNLPIGSTHSFRNDTDQPLKLLILTAPAGIEHFFRRAGHAVANPSSPIAAFKPEDAAALIRHAPDFGIDIEPPHADIS